MNFLYRQGVYTCKGGSTLGTKYGHLKAHMNPRSDSLRYEYKHAILLGKDDPGQRLSIMLRVRSTPVRHDVTYMSS